MKNIIRIYNLTVRFLKFILNIEIYEEFVEFLFKLISKETLFYVYINLLFSIHIHVGDILFISLLYLNIILTSIIFPLHK